MLRLIRNRAGYLVTGTALFLAGFVIGEQYRPQTAEAQAPRGFGDNRDIRPFRDGNLEGVQQRWAGAFGFAIPAEGGAIVRGQEGRAYLVTAEGEVSELDIGNKPRTPTPLRPE